MKPWMVERWDNNPSNTYTYKTWVFVTNFETEEQAKDYVKRASSEKQLLSYRREK
jgi:hypothetical protein